jgi:hypothetical protein
MTEEIIPGDCLDEYIIRRTWTSDDGCGNIATEIRDINVVDTTPPTVMCSLEQVRDDEDEVIEGLFRVGYSSEDNCDPDPIEMGYINVWGNDENCIEADEDEDPFIGYPVEVGDLVLIDCAKKFKPPCWATDEATDEAYEPDVIISGPAFVLHTVAMDRCSNEATSDCIQICPDPKNCIFSITLRNTMDVTKKFYWFEFHGSHQLFEVDGQFGEFETNCKHCLSVGDVSGDLTIICIETGYGSKLTKVCYVPEDYYMAPCP